MTTFLLIAALVGLSVAKEDLYFVCNDPGLAVMPDGQLGDPVDNEVREQVTV